jgi:hypothetical protein
MKRTDAQAFDEWMRRYIQEPERFKREFEDVEQFVREGGTEGQDTTYGQNCAEYLRRLREGEDEPAGHEPVPGLGAQ